MEFLGETYPEHKLIQITNKAQYTNIQNGQSREPLAGKRCEGLRRVTRFDLEVAFHYVILTERGDGKR